MRMKALLGGILLSLTSVGYAHVHSNCCDHFIKNGYFFTKDCGEYRPLYQYPHFCQLSVRHTRPAPVYKLPRCPSKLKGHYRFYDDKGLSIEQYFPVK